MRVIDEKLLQFFRDKGSCEWCAYEGQTFPHHIYSRGAGRLDLRENLVALCALCHAKVHMANSVNNVMPKRTNLLDLVAERENTTARAIIAKIHRLRRDTKVKVWRVS